MGAREEARRRGLARFMRGLDRRKKRGLDVEVGEAQMEPRYEVEIGEARMEPEIEVGEAVLEKRSGAVDDGDDDDKTGRPVGTGPHRR